MFVDAWLVRVNFDSIYSMTNYFSTEPYTIFLSITSPLIIKLVTLLIRNFEFNACDGALELCVALYFADGVLFSIWLIEPIIIAGLVTLWTCIFAPIFLSIYRDRSLSDFKWDRTAFAAVSNTIHLILDNWS